MTEDIDSKIGIISRMMMIEIRNMLTYIQSTGKLVVMCSLNANVHTLATGHCTHSREVNEVNLGTIEIVGSRIERPAIRFDSVLLLTATDDGHGIDLTDQ